MTRARRLHPGEEGFVLPGVVMFVIVLTILGLSLFTLSSFEAQFMNASLDKAQAFYAANGAIDRARFLLGATKRLQSVSTDLGPGVDYAVAIQDPLGVQDSVGDWTQNPPAPILIRVVTEKNGYRRSLEAQFDPNVVKMYDYLFSMSSPTRGLHVMDEGNDKNEYATGLYGKLWQTYAVDPFWSSDIFDDYDNSGLNVDDVGKPVPDPNVLSFLAQFPGVSAPVPSGNVFDLDGTIQPDSVVFYRSIAPDSIASGPDPKFLVHGIAVWAFDAGFACKSRTISVLGTSKDMLVLVAHLPSPGVFPYGLWFEGGIDSPNVPVILVSDARVMIDSNPPSNNVSTTLGWLSCYAPSAWIRGPKYSQYPTPPPPNLYLFYHPSNSPDAEYNLDKLFQMRALPNVAGPRNYLTYRPGSWRELPTN